MTVTNYLALLLCTYVLCRSYPQADVGPSHSLDHWYACTTGTGGAKKEKKYRLTNRKLCRGAGPSLLHHKPPALFKNHGLGIRLFPLEQAQEKIMEKIRSQANWCSCHQKRYGKLQQWSEIVIWTCLCLGGISSRPGLAGVLLELLGNNLDWCLDYLVTSWYLEKWGNPLY